MKEFTTVGDGEGEGEGGVLPDAIVGDILSRLQSKTLMKLRLVCKKWKSLISTSYFKRLHDEQSLESPNLLLLSCYPSHGCVLTTMSLTGDVLDEWDLPLASHNFFDMLPCQWGPNNLVCLITESKRFVLCNPSVRKISSLPRQSCSKGVGAYGFCYLPSRNQYVILSVSGHEWEMITFSNINNFEDLHTCCWKPIKDNAPGKVMNMPAGVSANGVLYWIGLTHSWSQSLLCFDLYEEKFSTVALRDDIRRAFSWSLHELKGDLHLMTPGDLAAGALSTLWKLDATNRTWIKQYTVYMLARSHLIPLMVCDDGELMFHDGKFLEWFSLRDEVFRIRRKGDKRNPHFMFKHSMKLHTDSLVLS